LKPVGRTFDKIAVEHIIGQFRKDGKKDQETADELNSRKLCNLYGTDWNRNQISTYSVNRMGLARRKHHRLDKIDKFDELVGTFVKRIREVIESKSMSDSTKMDLIFVLVERQKANP
jgi:hypothetical protein